MKKVFLPLAILTLLSASGCTKEGNYEKTLMTFSSTFSDHYLRLYDVLVEGRNFDGSDLSIEIASGDHSYTFESDATEGQTTVRVYSRLKDSLPEIDTAIVYDLTYKFSGTIRSKVKGGDNNMAFKSTDFTGGKKSVKISGKQLLNDTTSYLEKRVFDKAFQYSISQHRKSVLVDTEEINPIY